MTTASARTLSLEVDATHRVSALLQLPADARALYVVAHGAGAGMSHPFMAAISDGLAARQIGTLRYQFPYMEAGSRRPDAPSLAQATVRAAAAEAARRAAGVILVAGGKSFGGRMTSQAQAESPLPGVRGLAFLGFPLHGAGAPSTTRAAHLAQVQAPMLFLQGTRDTLAQVTLLQQVVSTLGARATLTLFDEADHSFHVPVRSGRSDAQVMQSLLDALAGWISALP